MRRWSLAWRWWFIVIVLSCLTSEVAPVASQAESSVGLSIVPAIVDLPLASSDTFKVTITSISEQSLPISVGLRALTPIDPTIDPALRQRYDASQWIVPDTTSLVLEPRESKIVTFQVEAPDDIGPGGHYALAVFRVLTPEVPTDATNARVNPEVTSVIILTMPGDINEAAELAIQQPRRWQWSPQRRLAFDFINRGNLHLLPESHFVISDLGGHVVETLPVASHLVLPGTASRFSVDWQPSKWGLYRYKIESSFGTPLKLLDATSGFFIVWPPVWIQLIGVVSFIGVGLVVKRGLKYLRRRLRRTRRLAVDQTQDRHYQPRVDPAKLDSISRSADVRDVTRRSRRKR